MATVPTTRQDSSPVASPEQLPQPVRATLAASDEQMVQAFLANYASNPNTFRAYERECRRLLWFCAAQQLTLADIRLEHLQAYQQLLTRDIPSSAVASRALPRDAEDYRPFTREKLGLAAQAAAINTLKRFFAAAAAVGYLPIDPAATLRPPKVPRQAQVERLLPVDYVLLAIDLQDKKKPTTDAARREQARNALLLRLFLDTGARLNEIAQADLSAIRRSPRDGKTWLHIKHGKGGKVRDVPLSDEVLARLATYRAVFADLIAAHDDVPLILPVRRRPNGNLRVTDDAIANALTACLNEAADALEQQGAPMEAVQQCRAASTHWLRHTHISHHVNSGVPVPIAQKNAGHGSYKTTAIYSHDDADLRHDLITANAPRAAVPAATDMPTAAPVVVPTAEPESNGVPPGFHGDPLWDVQLPWEESALLYLAHLHTLLRPKTGDVLIECREKCRDAFLLHLMIVELQTPQQLAALRWHQVRAHSVRHASPADHILTEKGTALWRKYTAEFSSLTGLAHGPLVLSADGASGLTADEIIAIGALRFDALARELASAGTPDALRAHCRRTWDDTARLLHGRHTNTDTGGLLPDRFHRNLPHERRPDLLTHASAAQREAYQALSPEARALFDAVLVVRGPHKPDNLVRAWRTQWSGNDEQAFLQMWNIVQELSAMLRRHWATPDGATRLGQILTVGWPDYSRFEYAYATRLHDARYDVLQALARRLP